jgi:hypothetical protein
MAACGYRFPEQVDHAKRSMSLHCHGVDRERVALIVALVLSAVAAFILWSMPETAQLRPGAISVPSLRSASPGRMLSGGTVALAVRLAITLAGVREQLMWPIWSARSLRWDAGGSHPQACPRRDCVLAGPVGPTLPTPLIRTCRLRIAAVPPRPFS